MANHVLDAFIQQVSTSPTHPAIIDKDNKNISYQQLDDLSNRLCALLQRRGVGPGDYIPLLAQRTPQLIIGMLAIVKAGAAYIPLDSSYPAPRIRYIIEQSRSPLILSDHIDNAEINPDGNLEIIPINNLSEKDQLNYQAVAIPQDALAYVIFTSGTTGTPKGVMVEHLSLWNIVRWHNRQFAMDADCRTTLNAGIGFDVAQWEIWSALTSGAALCLPAEEQRLQPAALLQFFADRRLTHAFVPTVLVPDVVRADKPARLALRYLFTAGEKLAPLDPTPLGCPLIDYYGPTEATIFATCNPLTCAADAATASIGRPVTDTEIFILDEQLQPVSGDAPGELFISGSCLARGYLHNPQLSAEKFLQPAGFNGKRLYRSGDRARWLADGRIQYLGRLDDQVKIRGNRIELGEIESVIMQTPGVSATVAVVTEPEHAADKKIVACLVADAAQPDLLDAVKARLKKTLPSYFLPADYLLLPRLPLNANGKTDKAALLSHYAASRTTAGNALPDAAQEQVAAVWRELLALNAIGADDNFFDIGGHSLLAARLAETIGQRLGVKTYVRDIYEFPTVAALTRALAQRSGQAQPELDSEPVRALQEDAKLPPDVQINPHYEPQQLTQPRAILLTGASGFVGSHLLADLLATRQADIYCLVRGDSAEQAGQRLDAVLQKHHIALSAEQRSRVYIVPGNLAEPRFALPDEQYQQLCRQVDIIYHSASAVNFIQPYSYMKRDNVQGLNEIIRFAAHLRTKPLMLLSTISVYSWGHLHTGKRVMLESDDIDQNLPAVLSDLGYVRSKWVMEKIADLAAQQGLPLMTFRLGYATSHSRSGVSADYQWWGQLVQTCLSSGTVPDLRDLREGLTTVDYMTRAIAHISGNPQALGLKFNLIHEDSNNLTLQQFFRRLEDYFGYRFRQMPYHDWLAQWQHDENAPLYPLLSLFRDNMSHGQAAVQLYQDTYQWDCSNVKRFLAGSGIEEPRFTRQELENYLYRLTGKAPVSLTA
ncbi:non-ribosomal peptide synthetase family protein [Serratia rubidaea]|uniref:non-ribosomal peptide synthetase family protein n=1 Tax=Serratia rubidaea TaxID=61652 RepID=UPI001783A16B|nr:non-ribosomal peptide synthetase [Serratia rubidaea]MBD8453203.1 amino acid adenylation domain-containing protein [Serratia rubidaea]UJD78572.1 amino acid adenylation domain-containing protein [Serratia rubidaea]UJD83123.1 amino acid adenylation domain-containing protein [Serratia rubidaea]